MRTFPGAGAGGRRQSSGAASKPGPARSPCFSASPTAFTLPCSRSSRSSWAAVVLGGGLERAQKDRRASEMTWALWLLKWSGGQVERCQNRKASMSPVTCEGLQLLGTEDSNFYVFEAVTLMLGWGWLKNLYYQSVSEPAAGSCFGSDHTFLHPEILVCYPEMAMREDTSFSPPSLLPRRIAGGMPCYVHVLGQIKVENHCPVARLLTPHICSRRCSRWAHFQRSPQWHVTGPCEPNQDHNKSTYLHGRDSLVYQLSHKR